MESVLISLGRAEAQILSFFNKDLTVASATHGWPLTSFGAMLAINAAYLLLVVWGNNRSARRAPPLLPDSIAKPAMVVYNAAQVVLSFGMAWAVVTVYVQKGYRFVCNSFDESDSSLMPRVMYIFYLSKIFDFFDTIFIVCRGAWRQLSFLHCYHHTSTFFTCWLLAVAGFTGDVYFIVGANSFVHFVMYGLYLLKSAGYEPTWSKYVTQLQMTQFCFMLLHGFMYFYSTTPDNPCAYPPRIAGYYLFFITSLFALFLDFYFNRYTKREPAPSAGAALARRRSSASAAGDVAKTHTQRRPSSRSPQQKASPAPSSARRSLSKAKKRS